MSKGEKGTKKEKNKIEIRRQEKIKTPYSDKKIKEK